MHLKRWITGIIAIPILILIIGPGPRWVFLALLWAVSLAGILEFYRLTAAHLPTFVRWSNCLLTLVLLFSVYRGQTSLIPFFIALWALIPMAFFMLWQTSPKPQWTAEIGKALLGPVYVGIPLVMLMYIDRHCPLGNIWVLFLVFVVFSGDTGAYYFGKYLGRHKLHEAVSPRKTWEGAAGGLVGSLVGAIIFLRLFTAFSKADFHAFDAGLVVLVLCLSGSGQIGDLAESMFKRNHGIKDSGQIFPGHGGMLDRLDALLFAIPVLYVYISMGMA